MAEGDETFRWASVVYTTGMVLPGVAVALARDAIVSTLTYPQFLIVLAISFSLITTALIDRLDLDRTTFLFASFVWPVVVFLAILFAVSLLNADQQLLDGPVVDVVFTLWGHVEFWETTDFDVVAFWYPAAFVAGGIGAVYLPAIRRRLANHSGLGAE